MSNKELEQKCINTIRVLSADIVEKAKSGHPGLPMGAAALAYILWTKIMKYNPVNPNWPGRDKFILSAGHGSALLYSMLHLTGYDLSLEDLKKFRQWKSKTPGHPEYGETPGVETTTGPLGQGFANGVGFAIAERFLAEYFNRPGYEIIDNYTYVLCSDGDLMEGVTSEAASIAGHLKLHKLIYIYDDNNISIEGDTELAFSEIVSKRFEAYGWQVIKIDGNDTEAFFNAVIKAHREENKPTLIQAKTHIGYGSPHLQDTAKAHGSPLGEEELKLVKKNFGFPEDKSFYIPEDVSKIFLEALKRGKENEEKWQLMFNEYSTSYPELSEEWKTSINGELPLNAFDNLPLFNEDEKYATRHASGKVLNSIIENIPLLVGGSADLAPSTMTNLKGYCDLQPDHYGCPNFHFGVREHAMGSIINGISITKQLIPYCATFLTFSDYMRPAIRLSALMKIRSIFIFTHDSIGLGEDGPTHQPVEHISSLRVIPGLTVIRPADANETSYAWKAAIENKGPTALILSRQKLPVLDINKYPLKKGVKKGAYILTESDKNPEILIIATGSEVHLALEAFKKLKDNNKLRVISMPSWELFEKQPDEYRKKIIPKNIQKRIIIEAGSSYGWHKWSTDKTVIISIDKFGASAPASVVMDKYGFTVENVINKIEKLK